MAHQTTEPIPILLLRCDATDTGLLGPLLSDTRVEPLITESLTPEAVALAHKVAAVMVVTANEPLACLAQVTATGIETPIVIATALDAACIELEKAGAHTCVPLPIRAVDVERLLSRLAGHACSLKVDGVVRLVLDPLALVVRLHERTVHLSQREFAVLYVLCSRAGQPVTAEELLTRVWGRAVTDDKARPILEVYIFQLRRKLERLGLNGVISTVRGVGYALIAAGGAPPRRSLGPRHVLR